MPSDSESKPPKKKVLDLLEDQPKPSRRERQREAAVKAKPTPPAAPVKKAALDIFEDKGEKKKTSGVRKTERSGKSVVPTISKVLDKEDSDLALPPLPPLPDISAILPTIGGIPSANPAPETADPSAAEDEIDPNSKVISIKPPIIVADLATRMGLKSFILMKDLIALKIFVSPNQAIEPDIAAKVCEIHGFVFEREKREKGAGVHKQEEVIAEPEAPVEEPEELLKPRAPIITIMGHVDHGKTTLLDTIRKSRVASSEAGGITQHVGAYQVFHNGQPITFLDTPGHAIFSNMRARGADVTDIVVIVVAANDGVMPQTREAIEHAKKAGRTIVIAFTKCDLPTANIMRAKTQLAELGLQTTDFGGDTEFAEVSAYTGEGMEHFLELLLLQAEVMELKANPKGHARASIIEARVVAGRGATATAIVESGTLKVGTPFICGPFAGKVRNLSNDLGESIKSAGPGTPVEIIGFEDMPHVGDELVEMDNERAAKRLAEERQAERRSARLVNPLKARMEDIFSMVNDSAGAQKLKIVLKCDVQGSVEAIKNALESIESKKVECQMLVAGVGPISESDILMASSANAIVIGFNVKVEGKAVKSIKSEHVQVKLYSVVYELIDQVREAMKGLLEPLNRENIVGLADVKKVFKLTKGVAAGSYVKQGKILRKAHARVVRGGVPIFDGKMSTLRHYQNEVDEIKVGSECGIRLGDFDEYLEGDIIECYTLEKVPQDL
ncbi:MAG: translation initiation factor [Verrucomicrobiota bacterium]|jgi:translation initiation factor IF-2